MEARHGDPGRESRRDRMSRVQRLKIFGAGLLAGVVATLLMALLMAAGRT